MKDVYAHLAGLWPTSLGGRFDGVGTDEWTGRQVAERTDRSLTENGAEWASWARAGEALRALPGRAHRHRPVDPRAGHPGAVGKPGSRDGPACRSPST